MKNIRKLGYLSDIIGEFETKGFIEPPSNSSYILNKLRDQYREYLKIFNSGFGVSAGRTGSRYGTYDIFGDRICYYYDIRKEKEFVNHLVKKFYDNNPVPDKEIRKVFTRILHIHRLHWYGCRHSAKIRYDVKEFAKEMTGKGELNKEKKTDRE